MTAVPEAMSNPNEAAARGAAREGGGVYRWYVVALDLKGHGRSSHPASGWYHYVDYFDDLRAALDHFGWERLTWLGHSLGGTHASLFAALYPERVETLLLIEALGPLTATPEQSLDQLRRGIDERAAFAKRRPLRVFPDLDSAIAVRMAASGLSRDAAKPITLRSCRSRCTSVFCSRSMASNSPSPQPR